MFQDSLLESSGRLGRHNPWTAVFSFTTQAILCGMLLLLSLIYTDALPRQQLMSMLEAPSPPAQSAPAHHAATRSSTASSQLDHGVLRVPLEVPRTIASTHDDGPPSEVIG